MNFSIDIIQLTFTDHQDISQEVQFTSSMININGDELEYNELDDFGTEFEESAPLSRAWQIAAATLVRIYGTKKNSIFPAVANSDIMELSDLISRIYND